MLQRIQSVWLFFAALAAFLTIRLSFYSGNFALPGQPATFTYLNASFNLLLVATTTAIICVILIDVFLYKNRKLQFRVALLAIFLSLLNIFLYYNQIKRFAQGNYDLTALVTLAIPVLLILAARGINKDEKLVRSLNRLR